MKKCAVLLLLAIILSGCSGTPDEMEAGLQLRSKLLQASSCTFQAVVIADYDDKRHSFSMQCDANEQGDLMFTIVQPETISGISGKLSGEGGILTFDETVLHFDLMADDRLSPISAPWILLKTLRSGCITSCCREEDRIRLSVDDSYEDDALRLDIWLNRDLYPETADILFGGRRILSVSVEDFRIL